MGENKQAEKTAIVFDTNFIVEKLDQLIQVVKVLREKKYELYISQVVIDERKAQLCNEKKEKYNKIHDLAKYLTNYIEIKSKIPSSNHIDEIQKKLTQQTYERLFGTNIIKYSKSEEIFSIILERAFKKIHLL